MDTKPYFVGMDMMTSGNLSSPVVENIQAAPRIRRPDRGQMTWEPCCLEEQLPADHPARTIWEVTGRLDLSAFYEDIDARGESPGRSATDPRLLVALWLYAAVDGLGSGRELERLCGCQDAYRWLCGGVPVNYHSLNDFRVSHEQALDDLFTKVLAALMDHGIVRVTRISQDGTRVRASAGVSSFGREEKLRHWLHEAEAHIQALKQQTDDSALSIRQRAAREQQARQRAARIEAALAELPKIQAEKDRQKDKRSKERPPRASATDPEARIMKMPNAGYQPAYNVQLAADTNSRAIVGVDVCNARSDARQSEPMREQVERRTGQKVQEHLMDGGFVQFDSIERAEAGGVRIYAPPPRSRKDPRAYVPRRSDRPGVSAWRVRMASAPAQAIYRQRASVSETINADLRTFRGLAVFAVRGLRKVRCVALWSALAYNLMHFASALLT